jgi:hypothetical protein
MVRSAILWIETNYFPTRPICLRRISYEDIEFSISTQKQSMLVVTAFKAAIDV